MEQRRRRPPTQPQPQLQLPLHSEEAASLLREALFRLEAEEGPQAQALGGGSRYGASGVIGIRGGGRGGGGAFSSDDDGAKTDDDDNTQFPNHHYARWASKQIVIMVAHVRRCTASRERYVEVTRKNDPIERAPLDHLLSTIRKAAGEEAPKRKRCRVLG